MSCTSCSRVVSTSLLLLLLLVVVVVVDLDDNDDCLECLMSLDEEEMDFQDDFL
jgi:hypothetical protein